MNDESVPADGADEAVQSASREGIECRHGGSEHDKPLGDTRALPLPERTSLVEVGKGYRAHSLRRCSEAGTSGGHAGSKAEGESYQGTGGRVEVRRYLTQRRKDLDRKYEFRSSRLTRVFGRLLYERRIGEEELRGLGEDKMKAIRSCARFAPTTRPDQDFERYRLVTTVNCRNRARAAPFPGLVRDA